MKTSRIITQPTNITASKKLFAIFFVLLSLARVQAQGPVQPEAMQFEPVDVTDVVNLATGDFVYTIPLMSVPGPEGDYPIVLSYHSGIGPNQPATWVGLGWTLNPGAINRVLNGYPDDYDGDVIKTVYKSKGKKHHGVSLAGGWGPVGINMSYDTNMGFGANMSLTAGIADVGFAQASVGSNGASLSVGLTSPLANASVGIQVGSQGLTPFASVGFSPGQAKVEQSGLRLGSMGSSISVSKQGASFKSAGIGLISSESPGKGRVRGFSFGIPIIFPSGHWLAVGYSEYQWVLFDVNEEESYGALYQNAIDNERYKTGDYIYPSKDHFLVSAQGITGTMMVNYDDAYVLKDHDENNKQGYLLTSYNEGGENLTFTPNGIAEFRFQGDQGYNALSNTSIDTESWGEGYKSFVTNKKGGKTIEPVLIDGSIMGFVITDVDGMIYEFKKSSANVVQYSEYIVNGSPTLKNYNSLHGSYATTWFITAVKGPDYVDRGVSGLSDEDWGYWVKFDYESQGKPLVWRAPFSGWAPGNDANSKSFNLGIRETKYLSSIETSTHKVVFKKPTFFRKDIANPAFETNIDLNPKELSYSKTELVNGMELDGDYSWVANDASAQDQIATVEYKLELNEFQGDGYRCFDQDPYNNDPPISSEWGDDGHERFYTSKDFPVLYNEINIGSYNEGSHSTTVSFQNGNNYKLNYGPECIVEEKWVITFDLLRYLYEGDKLTKQLDQIELYNKSDLSTAIRTAKFDYDYSLRPNSNGSIAQAGDGALGGSLTLKAVHFEGQNGYLVSPPFRFEYANGDNPGSGLNPAYHAYDLDRWGSYRDPDYNDSGVATDRGERKNDTPQEKERADMAAAWSLTGIQTPTGSMIEIDYESDDYSFVNNTLEFWKTLDITINKAASSGNIIKLNSSINSTDVKVGQYLKIIEMYRILELDEYDPNWVIRDDTTYSNLEVTYEILDIDYVNNSITLDASINGLFQADQPMNTTNNTSKEYVYTALIVPFKTFGGGSRVKSISTIDGSIKLKSTYTYNDGNFSNGVTASLAKLYSGNKFSGPTAEEGYQEAYLDHDLSYGRPSPGVLYSKVRVMNVDELQVPINGYTDFEFYTAKDHKYQVTKTGDELSIKDYSGIYSKPKSTTYFEQVENGAGGFNFREASKDVFHYAFSDELPDSANVHYNNNGSFDEVANLINKPLGITQQKHISFNEVTNGNWKTNKIDRINFNVFDVSQTNTKYYYADDISTNHSSVLITKARTIGFDMYTGQPLVTVSQSSSDNELLVSKATPAWWKYPGMGDKNMLTQGFENTVYRASAANISDIDDPDLKNYNFSSNNSQVISSEVTTWSNQWYNGDYPNVWRKNDTYQFIPDEVYSQFPTSYLTYYEDGYKTPVSATPWRMTSNIVTYDHFGHVIESVNQDGTYQTVLYDESNNSLVRAVVSNARKSEVEYIDFENGYTQAGARTGKNYGVNLDGVIATTPSVTPKFGGKYKAGIWYSSAYQNTVPINGITFPATSGPDDWRFAQITLSKNEEIVASDIANFDDITIIPEYASISYFAYDPLTWKVTAMTGPDHRTTFYEYDDAGRLILTRDFEGNIISKNDYGYGNEIYIEVSPAVPDPLQQVTFIAHTLNPGLNIAKYKWSFGDGASHESTSVNTAVHTFGARKEYELVLTTEDNKANTRRLIKKIKVGVPIEISINDQPNCYDPSGNGNLLNFICDATVTATVTGEVTPATYTWYESSDSGQTWNLPAIGTGKTISFFGMPLGETKFLKFEVTDGLGTTEEKEHIIFFGGY